MHTPCPTPTRGSNNILLSTMMNAVGPTGYTAFMHYRLFIHNQVVRTSESVPLQLLLRPFVLSLYIGGPCLTILPCHKCKMLPYGFDRLVSNTHPPPIL